jgi:hypothetical protein
MKRLVFLFCLPTLFFLGACKKNDPNTVDTACEGGNFCFSLDNESLSIPDAKWRFISENHIRIEWQGSDGTNYKNVVLDIYGTETGVYAIQSVASVQTGSKFQHFINENGISKTIQGNSGSVEITAFDNETISGKFSMQAKDILNGNMHTISEGRFAKVPKD